jgi:hypothetical protein
MRRFLLVLLFPALLVAQTPPASSTQAIYDSQAKSTQKKFDYIRQNGGKANPNMSPTVLQEGEVNAWLESGNAELPKGVKKLRLTSDPNVIHATATVDFDEITAEKRSSNPLLSLFSGTHEVKAEAHAAGSGGEGKIHIDSVSIDGVPVPRMALQYFAEKYITPKYPNLGVDSSFELPYRIDSAQVGSHQLTIVQR